MNGGGQDAAILYQFIKNSASVVATTFNNQGMIQDHNLLFYKLLGLRDTPNGKNLSKFLTPESWSQLSGISEPVSSDTKLIFLDEQLRPIPLICQLFKSKKKSYIFGEKLMLTNTDILEKMTSLNNEMVNLTRELQRKICELEQANLTTQGLKGIIPICSFCRKIKDEEGYWDKLEKFVATNTEVEFSHSICPGCIKIHHSDIEDGSDT